MSFVLSFSLALDEFRVYVMQTIFRITCDDKNTQYFVIIMIAGQNRIIWHLSCTTFNILFQLKQVSMTPKKKRAQKSHENIRAATIKQTNKQLSCNIQHLDMNFVEFYCDCESNK